MNIQSFMIGVATAFFAIFSIHILYFRQERTRYQTVLGIIMAIWSLWTAKDMVITFPHMYVPQVLNWILIIDGWSAITYVVLVMEATSPGWTTVRRLLWLALPFVVFTVAYLCMPVPSVLYGYVGFLWFFAWGVVIVAWIRMKRYLKFLHANYSNIDDIDVSWLRPVFAFVIVGQLAWLVTSLYPRIFNDLVYYLLSIGLWLMVFHYSWNFHPIVMEAEEAPADVVADLSGKSPDEVAESVSSKKLFALSEEKLEKLMAEQQLYLNPDLTLAQLAKALGTNRTYMSNWLSDACGQTFYNYINRLRIERESLPLMQQHPEYTIEHIAEKSGFGSVSTFRRAFLKFTGQTPQAYKAMQQ